MGRKKKFIDKKKSATFQLLARDSSDPNYDNTPGSDRVFVRIDQNPVSVFEDEVSSSGRCNKEEDPNSIFADASEDNEGDDERGFRSSLPAAKGLPEHVRREILELGFPDDGYNYLLHLREIQNAGGGSNFYHNPKARLDQLPHDVKAYDASRVRLEDGNTNGSSIFAVASKTVGVRVQKVVDPDVAALLDDSDLSRFGSDIEELEEDFIHQANLPEEEEEDVEVDKRLKEVEEFGVTKKELGISDQQQIMDGLVFQNGVGNHLVEERDECYSEKPRVQSFLDDQFDLLKRQEYGTDYEDDDYANGAEEDESLAEKLKQALGGHVMDDLELSDKYKVPADLLHDNERPKSKELLDSAADVIRRCVEYAEKYENEDENKDKDIVLVEESSDESEMWDCETIVSTYSNLDNHPGKIGAPEVSRKKKLAETLSGASSATGHVISLRGKEKLPVDFLPHGRKAATEKEKDVGSKKAEQQKRKQHGQESKEEKKERKAAVKEERREARRVKKEVKELYRGEAQRAQKVAAVCGPSSIHLM